MNEGRCVLFFAAPINRCPLRLTEAEGLALNGTIFACQEPSTNGPASMLRVTGTRTVRIEVDVQLGPWLPMSLQKRMRGTSFGAWYSFLQDFSAASFKLL